MAISLLPALAMALAAQSVEAPPSAIAPQPPRCIPLHTAPAGEDVSAYGVWAAGPGYKASFHDGFVFYPNRNAEQRDHTPLRWQTDSITIGGQPLIDAKARPTHAHTAWRYEFQWPQVTEAYDVREDGVEQTFVVHHRPQVTGDLVIAGRVQSRLQPQMSVANTHAAVTFVDGGTPLVRYGAAFAVDAHGLRLPLTTDCDGTAIVITVPAAWLANAAFPVTVDPLTSPITLNQADIVSLSIDRENESTTKNVLVTYTIRSAPNDNDMFALLYSDTFNDPVLVFADFSASWSTLGWDAAYAGGADRWGIAYTSSAAGIPARGRVYLHTRGNFGLNTGPVLIVLGQSGSERHAKLSLGGSESGDQMLLAYESTDATVAVWCGVVGPAGGSVQMRTRISPPGHGIDGDRIDVSRDASATDDGWLVCYSALTATYPITHRHLYATRVTPTTLGAIAPVLIGSGQPGTELLAQVDGRDGRFLVLSHRGQYPFFWDLVAYRVDWPRNATAPTLIAERTLGRDALALGLAYDHISQSHWCVAVTERGTPYTARAMRLGFTGAVTESVALGAPRPLGEERTESVTFNARQREFQIAYLGLAGGGSSVQVQRMLYPADAVNLAYGQGCYNNAVQFSANRPYAGSEFFRLTLRGIRSVDPAPPDGSACVLMLSLAAAAIPLRNCTQLVSMTPGQHIVNLPVTMQFGYATVTYPLSDAPLLQRDMFAQWLWQPPLGSTVPSGMSNGMRIEVR